MVRRLFCFNCRNRPLCRRDDHDPQRWTCGECGRCFTLPKLARVPVPETSHDPFDDSHVDAILARHGEA